MVFSNDEASNALGVLRLGFVGLLAPLWLLGGIALYWFGRPLLGIGAVGIGLAMVVGGYRLYRAIQRPDVVRDERSKEAHHRAGYNAFWMVVLAPSAYVGFSTFAPSAVTIHIAQWGGFELAWSVSLVLGFVVYLGSLANYRVRGL